MSSVRCNQLPVCSSFIDESSDHLDRDGDLHQRDAFNTNGTDIAARPARFNKLCAQGTGTTRKRRLKHRGTFSKRVLPKQMSAPLPLSAARPDSPRRPASAPQLGSPRSFSLQGSDSSLVSTETSLYLGMKKVKTSILKAVTIAGLNGCTGIFLFGNHAPGHDFITGAHASPLDLLDTAQKAVDQARVFGKVTQFVVISPFLDSALQVGHLLYANFPDALKWAIPYEEGKDRGYYDFKAFYPVGRHQPIMERRYTPRTGPDDWGESEKWESIDLSPGSSNSRKRIPRFARTRNELTIV